MQKEAQKKLKYKSLCIEMWNMKCVITPVITAATGAATKVLKKNVESTPGKHSNTFTTGDSYT